MHNSYTKVSGTYEDMELMRLILTEDDPNKIYSDKYKKGIWDGQRRYFDSRSHQFPTGLLSYVCNMLDSHKVIPQIVDMRIKHEPLGTDFDLVDFIPRDYQLQLAQMAVERYRGIIHAATNAGKTEIAAMIIKRLGLPVVYCVHTNELLQQTYKVFKARGLLNIGIFGGGQYEDGQIMICMIQTLYRQLKSIAAKDLLKSAVLFMDEVHHQSSDSWYTIAMESDALYRYGMSGTPFRRDILCDLKLLGATGSAFPVRIDNKYLVEQGYSAVPYVIMMDYITSYTRFAVHYSTVYNDHIKHNVFRNQAIVQATESLVLQNRRVLVTVNHTDHGNVLYELMKNNPNFKVDFIHGACEYEYRQDALHKFEMGMIDVLIATTILNEGVSVPEISAVVLAAGGTSHIALLQRIGRGMRKKEHNFLPIIDFKDRSHNYMIKHTQNRMNIYKQQGFPVYLGKDHIKDLSLIEKSLPNNARSNTNSN